MYQSLLKSLNRLNPRAWDFIQLTRMDKPIGIYLLLWPTLWALWIAGKGSPSLANVVIFVLGVVLTRAGGCVINDWADRKVDGYVKRTEQRPLVSGKISSKEALVFFALLMGVSFLLVLCTNAATVWLSFGGLALALTYPFMKRYTYYPQVVLGAAFSWGMPMAFTAETGELPAAAWLLWIANLIWTVGYDTYYAMTDRDDDLKIGVKSTAILFGDADRMIILILQGLALGCLLLAGRNSNSVAGSTWDCWRRRAVLRGSSGTPVARTGCAASRRFCTTIGPGWRFLSGSCWITRCAEATDAFAGKSDRRTARSYRSEDADTELVTSSALWRMCHLSIFLVAGHVSWLLVLNEVVQRLAIERPLHRAIVTLDDGPLFCRRPCRRRWL